jgi:hypothetical protein
VGYNNLHEKIHAAIEYWMPASDEKKLSVIASGTNGND